MQNYEVDQDKLLMSLTKAVLNMAATLNYSDEHIKDILNLLNDGLHNYKPVAKRL